LGSVSGTEPYVITAALSHDGSIFAAGYNNGAIKLYSTANGSLIRSIDVHNDNVTSLAFSPDGRYLVSDSFSFDANTYIINVSSGVKTATLTTESWEPGIVSFSPDGRWVTATAGDGTHIYATSNWQATGTIITGIWEGVFTCDSSGLMLRSADNGSQTDVYSITTGQLSETVDGYPIYCLSDGRAVAVDVEDDTVTVRLVSP
jgi:WD40 repeat protein